MKILTSSKTDYYFIEKEGVVVAIAKSKRRAVKWKRKNRNKSTMELIGSGVTRIDH